MRFYRGGLKGAAIIRADRHAPPRACAAAEGDAAYGRKKNVYIQQPDRMSIACAAGRNPPLVPYTLSSRVLVAPSPPFLLSLSLGITH